MGAKASMKLEKYQLPLYKHSVNLFKKDMVLRTANNFN